jgi:hypothetical protein
MGASSNVKELGHARAAQVVVRGLLLDGSRTEPLNKPKFLSPLHPIRPYGLGSSSNFDELGRMPRVFPRSAPLRSSSRADIKQSWP